jgi:glycerophosphoryl diester phosphodiesterase
MVRVALLLIIVAISCGCSETALLSASVPRITSDTTTSRLQTPSQSAPASEAHVAPKPDSRAAKLFGTFRNAADPSVLVVAHRGDWHSAPENSLAAIESCIEMGVDMVEIDVRPTRDGRFVLMHDKTLERTTTGTGKVSNYTLNELQQFRLKDHRDQVTDQRPPSMEEALEVARGRILVYLDKSELVIPATYQVVDRLKMKEQVFFYGERPLAELKTACGPVLEHINYLPKIGDNTPHIAEYVQEYQSQLKPVAFVLSFANQNSPVLDVCRTIRGKKPRIWASPLSPEMAAGRTDEAALTDPDGNWGWLMDQGATIFCTDRPRELLAYLRKQGRHE